MRKLEYIWRGKSNASLALLCFFLFWSAASYAENPTALIAEGSRLYESGQIEPAREKFEAALNAALTQPNLHWYALMQLAWFEEAVGEHRRAIEHSNQALKLASKNKSQFQIGRSLIWAAWSYASIGLYELALELLEQAVEVGAPEGKIEIVPVWGFALQEMGHIYLRMGDLAQAKKAIERTTNFARERGIAVGVAEGGVYLSQIAFEEGDIASAVRLAEEALAAANDCKCSPFNTARARTQQAKMRWEASKTDPPAIADRITEGREALEYARKIKNKRYIAESALNLARMLPGKESFTERDKLVTEAFELLAESEDELEGAAQAQLGRFFAEKEEYSLAKFYLERGIEISAALFRKLDKAYAATDLANVQGMTGDMASHLSTLERATIEAETSGALQLAATNQEQLSVEYEQLGFDLLAYRWGRKALASMTTLLSKENDAARKQLLEFRRLVMVERVAELILRLDPDETGKSSE